MGIFAAIQTAILKPITWAGNVITSGIEKITGKKYGRTTAQEAQKTTFGKVISTGIAVTSAALGVAAVGAGSLAVGATRLATAGKAVAKFAAPKTLKGAALAAVAVPAIVGIVKANPQKAVETLINAPGKISNFAENVTTFAENPTAANAVEIVKDNPIISAGLAAAAALAVGKIVIPAAASLASRAATKENTAAMEAGSNNLVGTGKVAIKRSKAKKKAKKKKVSKKVKKKAKKKKIKKNKKNIKRKKSKKRYG